MSDLLIVSGNGRLGKDPEWKDSKNGQFLVFSVAASTGYGDRKTTNWIECSMFGKKAESVAQYLSKGKQVAFSGEMTIEKWESGNGKGTTVRCNISNLSLINDGTANSTAPRGDDQSREPARQNIQPKSSGFNPPSTGFSPPKQREPGQDNFSDYEVPF